jgi:phospholipid-binding lipoprotein MlaA
MRSPFHPFLLLGAIMLAGSLAGCAPRPNPNDPDAVAEYNETNDPLEPTNRIFYAVNDGLDTVILRPIALAYHYAMPQPVRNGVHNVLANLSTPVLLANNAFQAQPRRAGNTAMRFLINTTVGVVGIFDVASDWGYPIHDTDFGVTLALWGVPDGPFLFLPVLGPTNPRDAAGFGADVALDPFTWVGQGATVTDLNWARYSTSAVDQRERVLDEIDQIKNSALDPYATFRSLYRQHRASQIEESRTDAPSIGPTSSAPQPSTPAPAPGPTSQPPGSQPPGK